MQKHPFALAALALCASAPLAAHAAPTVSFSAPAAGATISQPINQSNACAVTGLRIQRVEFSIRPASGGTWTALNTEQDAPWQCNLDPSRFATGQYTLRAIAFDANSGGASASATRTINISNGSTGGGTPPPPPPATGSPTVSFTAPANNGTISTAINQSASCQVNVTTASGRTVKQVQFFLDSTPLNIEGSAPWQCNIDPRNHTNGAHVLRARVTDSSGATGEGQINVNIANGSTSGGTPPPPPPPSSPTASFTAPANNGTISTAINQSASCQVNVTTASGRTVKQVQFFLDSTPLNIEGSAPWQCNIDPRNHTNGAHVLRARVTDSSGATGEGQINVNIANGIATPAPNTPPSVTIMKPDTNATLTGSVNSTGCYANASDTNGSVSRVDFFLSKDGTSKSVGSRTTPPYQCSIETTTFENGAYTLMAVATDNNNASTTAQRSVNISNPPAGGGGGGGGTGSGTTLPANGARAVATFESLGMYWRPGSNPGAAGCSLRYRKVSESAWRDALPMWYDSRDGECRGSIVHLDPGTDYAVEMGVGSAFQAGVNTKTWSENFPIASTVQVQSGSGTLAITQGGTPQGYVLYTGPATLDAADGRDHNITISAPYVIVRGLTLRGARIDSIRLLPGAHDVIIEDNDISGWGRYRTTLSNGWRVGMNMDAAVRAVCTSFPAGVSLERTVIQRNRMHDPRYTTNSWDFGHPLGPQAVGYSSCGGNHVIRHNEIYSADGTKYMNDAIGGSENFSNVGFPNSDSDIYGNRISHVWDDAIEAEGANRNVRIWSNYTDRTNVGIATTATSVGPVYVFRNVFNRSQKMALQSLDTADRVTVLKSGTRTTYGDGRRYVFHNTLLQATQPGLTWPLGAGSGLSAAGTDQPLTNTVSRNNILHVWKPNWQSIRTEGGGGNDFDYDLRNGTVSAYAGAETNGIVGTPIYAPGHGWQSESGGLYQLAPNSPGYDGGARIPNFNDGFTGAGPDMGAHEAGAPAMKFGLGGSAPAAGAPTAGTNTSTAIADGGTSTGSGGGGGGVCSSIGCAAQ